MEMSMEVSFRLVPNEAGGRMVDSRGAVSSDSSGQTPKQGSEVSSNQIKKGEGESARKSILKTSTAVGALPLTAQSETIPGTWHMTLSSKHPTRLSSRSIRATPFEPLVHQRNLPKDGTISPLRINEYHANRQERLMIPSLRSGHVPPVHEIRIPTPQHQDDSSLCSADGENASEEDYKNLFFSSQRELHAAQAITAKVMEENRLLKRRLIEMQKQLFAVSRNRRSLTPDAIQNTAWSIPTNSSSQRKKQRTDANSRVIGSSTVSTASTVGEKQPSSTECPPCISKSVSADAATSTAM